MKTNATQPKFAPFTVQAKQAPVMPNGGPIAHICLQLAFNPDRMSRPAWLLRLRRRDMSVLFVHHSGKNGRQRGT